MHCRADTDTVPKSKCTTSIHERALKQMMNGQVNSKRSTNVVWVLQKPDWMLQPSAGWSDEQKDLAQQFQAEQKRLDEQRESRRQILEGEVCLQSRRTAVLIPVCSNRNSMQMRNTRAASDELCTKTDEEMLRLLNQRIRVDQIAGEVELIAISACRGADSLKRLGPNSRHEMLLQGSRLQMREQMLRAAVQFIRETVRIYKLYGVAIHLSGSL